MDHEGPAEVETFTVMHDKDGAPELGLVALLLDDGRRAWGKTEDPDALAQVTLYAGQGLSGGTSNVVLLALDIRDHPDVWADRAQRTGEFALDRLRSSVKTDDFEWESSASDAWTSGGTELAQCMADNGRAMVAGSAAASRLIHERRVSCGIRGW